MRCFPETSAAIAPNIREDNKTANLCQNKVASCFGPPTAHSFHNNPPALHTFNPKKVFGGSFPPASASIPFHPPSEPQPQPPTFRATTRERIGSSMDAVHHKMTEAYRSKTSFDWKWSYKKHYTQLRADQVEPRYRLDW